MRLKNGNKKNKYFQKIQNLKLHQAFEQCAVNIPFSPISHLQLKSFEEGINSMQNEVESIPSFVNKRITRRKQNSEKPNITNFNLVDSFLGNEISFSEYGSQKFDTSTICNTSAQATNTNKYQRLDIKNIKKVKNWKAKKWIALDEISEFRCMNVSI